MTNERKIIENKFVILRLAQELGNVSEACKVFGYHNGCRLSIQRTVYTGGEKALKEISTNKPKPKN